METPEFTVEELAAELTAAGTDESLDLAGGLDTDWVALGVDSLVLLETAGRVERARKVRLPDDAVDVLRTPRDLLAAVNALLEPASEART
ncbi:acyl carrier protein [Streptomyces sp. NPDC035033]|uniref:acyl carrier protein n=1 Tax=Streptomyces sp. NPDC035033 TaxID=3155368 RepID=UPI0033C5528A